LTHAAAPARRLLVVRLHPAAHAGRQRPDRHRIRHIHTPIRLNDTESGRIRPRKADDAAIPGGD
jgi:hypothetical protein